MGTDVASAITTWLDNWLEKHGLTYYRGEDCQYHYHEDILISLKGTSDYQDNICFIEWEKGSRLVDMWSKYILHAKIDLIEPIAFHKIKDYILTAYSASLK